MFKKLLFFCLPICAWTHSMIYFPKDITFADAKKYASQKKVIIGYDVHDVLVRKDKLSKFKTVIKHMPTIIGSKITDGKMWNEINQVRKTGASGQAYAEKFKNYGYSSLAKMAQESANGYKPRKGIATLVHEMKLLGYTQRFASNIGDIFLTSLSNKLKTKYHIHMLDMIEPGKVVDYSQYGKSPLPKPLAKHLASQPKPHPIFFQEFIDAWNAALDNLMIFIDDKLENVKAAVTKGFIGIHVNAKLDDAQFVKQLRTAFQSLGLYDTK